MKQHHDSQFTPVGTSKCISPPWLHLAFESQFYKTKTDTTHWTCPWNLSLQTDKGIPIGNLFEASTHSSVSVASELNYGGVSIHLECQLFCEFLSCHLMYFLTGRSICSIGRPLMILLMVPAKASTKKLSRLLRGTSDESRVTLPAKVGTLLQNNIGLFFKQIY